MPEMSFTELPPDKFKKLNDIEKAKYLLAMPVKMQSDKSAESWTKCFETAQTQAQVSNITAFWDKVRADMERELKASADKLIPETDFTDVSDYTKNGTFNALKFINDKRHCKTTWDGHILSAEDVETARAEIAKGTPRRMIHDIIRKQQRQRQIEQTKKQVDKINRRSGKIHQPYCMACMNRGYIAVVENDVHIALQICFCLRQREKAADEQRKAEAENKSRKRGKKQDE